MLTGKVWILNITYYSYAKWVWNPCWISPILIEFLLEGGTYLKYHASHMSQQYVLEEVSIFTMWHTVKIIEPNFRDLGAISAKQLFMDFE